MGHLSVRSRATKSRLNSRVKIAAVILTLGSVGTWSIGWWPQGPIGPIIRADDAAGGWPMHSGTAGGLKYSGLNQIERGNVRALAAVWTYSTGDLERVEATKSQASYSMQTTPILVDDKLIGCTSKLEVFALDAETGRQKWRFNPHLQQTKRGATFSKCRGVTAWTDPLLPPSTPCKTRIILGAGLRIIELDPRTGTPCDDFGEKGTVTVKVDGLAFPDELQLRSPAAMIGDTVIFGSTIVDSFRRNSPSGKVRAFDVRTGKLRWEYDAIPRDPANPAYATWGGGSAAYVGASNVWSFISVDPENNLVFLPTTAPAADYYGGHRPGDNRWSTSLVALDGTTGKQVWAFQTTHHDIFDYDLPAQPILMDIVKDGRKIPVVVQVAKQGFIFVFHRLTGKPVYPIVERPVPQGTDVPGEWLSPTQPYPASMPTLTPTSLKPSEAWGFTPYDRADCRKQIEKYRSDGLYTPPTMRGSIFLPSIAGGANWGGGAIDPARNLIVVPTMNLPVVVTIVPRGGKAPNGSGISIEGGAYPMYGTPYEMDVQFLVSSFGAPCSAPPWAQLSALDLGTGKLKWQVPLGSIENLHRFAPPLMMGSPFTGGPLITKGGLVFMAGGTDAKLRAFDVDSGKVLWTGKLPAPGMSVPMTYSIKGRQYVVIAAGGSNVFPTPIGDSVVAFALDGPLTIPERP